ncbi:geranylgeranylglycerol-phosphate geranylgeranyltransferase [Methermicoccus shengliensis]|uniref:Digeranylgeranylglyceryl phosphate synthase n=1 Tax=Methermicoccus shengliensis TaxID=660064 RepID=A0A832VN24_9EURY|nr:geranylgeranylglycerol-phosphate geranylgeranyltransferase [Methermicoccus shengliensis]KUK04009.1 MAG: Digeranylgeranylglyceryl phosphate synthase [Euryarchaeota archaeon 55_53]KUK29669.1 MAG: Digeranylgeranylglyceryl phosphate synthase [Methanosarcinales archeaon 56_1174]HIH69886.1 geranylgeranylglycerol-phosphate geranylgeranyltransferase [Methermicoccus shengliensis]
MRAYIELLRVHNCAMAALASLIGVLVALPSGWWPAPHLVLSGMGAVFLITGAGNAINDVYDVEIDKINRPTRPLPSGKIAMRGAILTSLTLFLMGIAASLYISVEVGFLGCFALALFNSVLLVEYARRLKRTALYGNLTVAYLTASTFLYGAAMLGQSTLGDVVVLVLLAFLATLARELIKDVEDIQGDEALGASTLPILVGKKWAVGIALACIVLGVALSPLPMLEGFGGLGERYLWVVAGADAGFLVSALHLIRGKPSSASKGVKLSMMLALVAFMAGSIG